MKDKDKKTILLVEDEAILAITEKLVLEKYGYNVITADSGEKAVEFFNKNKNIDLILMDIDLGKGLDGTETAALILKDQDIPVVFLSSHTEPAVVEKTENITSYGYVVKSSSITVLDASIKMAFKLFEAKRNGQMKEAILQESEEKYRLLHETAGLGIAYYSIDGLVFSYNQHAAKHMNGAPEDFNGKSIYDIFPKSDADFYFDRIKKAALSEDPVTYDDMITLPIGIKYFLSTFTRIVDKNKKILGIQIISQEITDIKQTKKKLHESKKNTETLLNISSEIILSLDFHGKIVLLNENGHRLLGYTSPELIGKNWFDTCLPVELREGILQYFDTLKNGDTEIFESHENEVVTKGGVRKLIFWNNILLKDKNGIFMGIFSSGQDISERKQKDNILRESVLRLENIIEGTHVGTWEWNIQTGETIFNNLWAEIVGYTLDELAPVSIDTWLKLAHPDDLKQSEELLTKHFAGELPYYHFESRMKHKDGHWVWVLDRGKVITWSADGKPLMMFGTHTDITERKLAEEELRIFKTISDNAVYGKGIADLQGNLIYTNKFFANIHGYEPVELIGKHLSILHGEEHIEEAECLNASMVQNGHFLPTTLWHCHKDGTIFPMLMSGILIKDDYGNPKYMAVSAVDITDFKRSEMLLQENLFRSRSYFEQAPFGIFIANSKGEYLEVNPKACELTGYSEKELTRMSIPDLLFEEAIEDGLNHFKELLEHGRSYGDILFRTKNGTILWWSVAATKLSDDMFLGFCEDITERKQAEESIKALLAEKELILKEVHHRLKNNMNTIKGLLFLQIAFLKDPLAISALQGTISRVDSMVVLYDTLYCSHNFNDISVLTYLPSLIDEIIANFPGSESVKVEKKIDDFILEVKLLQPLGIIINELLANIMKYAFTGRENNLITVSATLTDKKVSIIVSDNGNGIPESVTFENSTGFGMQLVSMLTVQIGGNITIERERERERFKVHSGIRFALSFPSPTKFSGNWPVEFFLFN